MHWSEKYLNKGYENGVYNCSHLVMDIQEHEFGRVIDLPVQNRDREVLADEILETKNDFEQVDTPEDGDIVLFYLRGVPSHVGVYTVINNIGMFIHSMSNKKGVCIHSKRHIDMLKLEIEGYYRIKDGPKNAQCETYTQSSRDTTS